MNSPSALIAFAFVAMALIGVASLVNDDVKKAKHAEQERQRIATEQKQQAEQERKTPYLMGYDACLAGIGMSKNPYNFLHTKDYAEWQRGYVQCQSDRKKVK